MAVKTFAVGETLTASDTNTYLANAGLVQITSGITVSSTGGTAATVSNGTVTIGTGNTSVTVSNAFSATYDNYKIVVSGGNSSVAGSIQMQLSNSTGSTYQTAGLYTNFGTATLNAYGPAASTTWTDAIVGGTTLYMAEINVFSPFLSTATFAYTTSISTATSYQFTMRDSSTASSSGFKFTPNSGTMTGGTIRVYGFRQV